jgi:hypothetical protein
MDCIDMVRLRVGRCDADGFRHACGRHAPRVGETVRDNNPFVAAVGFGDDASAAPRAPIPTGEIEALRVTWLAHVAACASIGLIFAAWTTWLEVLLNPYANSSAPSPFAHAGLQKGGEKLSSQKINELPLNGRDFSTLLLLAAGTMTNANGATNFMQQFAIDGQRGVEAMFEMDSLRFLVKPRAQ